MPVNKIIYGNRTLIDLTDSTVGEGDLREGVVAYDRSGMRIVGNTDWHLTVNTGGAKTEEIADTEDDYMLIQGVGVTNIVNGSFTTYSEGGLAQTVSIPYVGDGYPISVMIYVTGGPFNPDVTSWYSAIHQYAIGMHTMAKRIADADPDYLSGGNANQGCVMAAYKSSSTSATSIARDGSMSANVYGSSDAGNTIANCCRFKSATELSVFISSDSYGLMPGVSYTYSIVYSE